MQSFARQFIGGLQRADCSFEPVDYYVCFHLLEFLITGHEVCLSLFRQRGREAIGKRHLVFSLKPTGFMSEIPVGVNPLYSQLL